MVAEREKSRVLEQGQCSDILCWAISGGVAPLIEHGFHPKNSTIEVTQFNHGRSNPTYLVTVRHSEKHTKVFKFVIRSQPKGKLLKGAHRIDREFRVLSALAFSPVPVPNVYGFCEDISLLGAPFYAMSYVEGRVFKDVSLTEIHSAAERAEIFNESLRVLRALRQVNINQYHLQGLSSSRTPWIDRQLTTWHSQYWASKVVNVNYADMELLHHRLVSERHQTSQNVAENPDGSSLIHGDFRLDNLIFHRSKPKCLAVLDWELVSTGNPIADLASFLTPYHMPNETSFLPLLRSMAFSSPRPPGIPREDDILAQYLSDTGVEVNQFLSSLRVYLSFAFFKFAAIIYGIQYRTMKGNAVSTNAVSTNAVSIHATAFPKLAHVFVQCGLDVLKMKANTMLRNKLLPCSARGAMLLHKIISFINQELMPLEHSYLAHIRSSQRWEPWAPLESLKERARDARLWNFFLPKKLGGSLSAAEYAPIAEITGRCLYAAEVFNCSAPDTGNMDRQHGVVGNIWKRNAEEEVVGSFVRWRNSLMLCYD
eukprot:gb/GEZJ01004019.1/.p1 GENE.gb/GEZJ01004019.1/~~gb/GEZJ01004019.1/.p1  ORF type:complete len:571 (-),score=44.68 gb/GEZJ01004019.1/:2473-4089(-)